MLTAAARQVQRGGRQTPPLVPCRFSRSLASSTEKETSRGNGRPGHSAAEQSPASPPPLPPPVMPAMPAPAHWLDRLLPGARHWLEDKNRAWWIKGMVEGRTK